MRPVYIDCDEVPAGALYVQEKVDGWGVQVRVRNGVHTVRTAKTGRPLWTEEAGGPEGDYQGEWVHGTQRSLTDPRRGKVVLYDYHCGGAGYLSRLCRCNVLASYSDRYLTVDTVECEKINWQDALDIGWEGVIYRTEDPNYVWRRKRSVELDGVVVAVEAHRVKVRCDALASDVWVAAGLSADLRPEIGFVVRITGMEITAAGKVRHPVLEGIKEGKVCSDCGGDPCVCEVEAGDKCWCDSDGVTGPGD